MFSGMMSRMASLEPPSPQHNILWQPWPGFQTKALECGTYEALFGGAAGPGKTDVLIACGARYCQHPSARVLFLRTSYTDLQDVRDRMATLYTALGAVWQSEPKRWQWPSGAVLEMGYAESVAEVSRYLGREYTAVLFDELGLVKDETVWDLLSSRVRSKDPTVPLRMRASANPGGPGHAWLKSRFVTATDGGKRVFVHPKTKRTRAYVPGTARDNPSLPPEYWEGLSALPPALQAALKEGDWDAGLGLFYPELAGSDGARRIITMPLEDMPDWWDYWGGYDWGFRHPAVFVALARDDKNRIIVLDTLYMHRKDDAEQAASVSGLFAVGGPQVGNRPLAARACLTRVFAGHDAWFKRQAHSASPDTVADVFDRHHVALFKANLDRAAGSRSVRRYLSTDLLFFRDTPGNQRLLDELRSLTPDLTHPETPRKRDADADTGLNGDDGPDALRYALATASWLPTAPAELPLATDDPNVYRQPVEPHEDATLDTPPDGPLDQYPEGFI